MRVTNVLTEQQALELVAYLLSAAEITLFEPDLYGPFLTCRRFVRGFADRDEGLEAAGLRE